MSRLPRVPCYIWTPSPRPRWACGLALLFVLRCPVFATGPDDLCAPDADPCVVSGTVQVDDGSVFDVRPRALVVRGRLDVGSGTMALLASRLVVEGELRASAGAAPGGTIAVVAGTIEVTGAVNAGGAPGGTVTFFSPGDIEFGGSANLDHAGEEEGGGELTLSGENVAMSGTIVARGGADDSGGDVTMTARSSLTVDGTIDVSGGDGGTIDLAVAGGELTIGRSANLRSNATGKGCDGGDVELAAEGGSVRIDGRLSADGRGGDEDTGGGSGGSITADASGDVVVSLADTRLNLTGGGPDGFGGDVELSSDGAVRTRGVIDVHAGGNDGAGGSLAIDAGGTVELNGNVLAYGDGGGDVDVASEGEELRVGPGVDVQVNATGGGGGGDVAMTSEGTLVVEGTIRADGSNDFGSSTIALTACTLRVERGGSLSSTKNQGRNVLVGRDETVVAGRLVADTASGANELRFGSPDRRPVILASAMIEPPANEIVDPSVQPCGPTATLTPTATATPTPTPTPRAPVPCVGDCDDDGQVEVGELVVAVSIALGHLSLDVCESIDVDGDGRVRVDEVVAAVDASLGGCAR